jgi:hypothetical protein
MIGCAASQLVILKPTWILEVAIRAEGGLAVNENNRLRPPMPREVPEDEHPRNSNINRAVDILASCHGVAGSSCITRLALQPESVYESLACAKLELKVLARH